MSAIPSISLASTLNRSEDFLAAEIDDELVLMSVEQGNYYGLDAIGAVIWHHLDRPSSVADLCAALSKEYDGDIDTIRSDVLVLLNQLAGEGLIKVVS